MALDERLFIGLQRMVIETLLKFLVWQGQANVEAIGSDERTPLHLASHNGCCLVIEFLVQQGGANVEALDRLRQSPRHFLATGKYRDFVGACPIDDVRVGRQSVEHFERECGVMWKPRKICFIIGRYSPSAPFGEH